MKITYKNIAAMTQAIYNELSITISRRLAQLSLNPTAAPLEHTLSPQTNQ